MATRCPTYMPAMWYALLAPAAAQAPPPLPPDARFALALFCNPTCSEEVVETLDDGLAAIAAKFGFSDNATRPIRVMGMAGTDFGIPDAAFVELYGVGVDRPEELAKSQEVLLAWFAGPREEALATLTVAHKAFGAAAKRGGGWVEDLDTQRLYGADAWAELGPRGPITDWFVVDAEPMNAAADPDTAETLRLVTRGLRRYGDFELVVEDVPADAAGDVSFVVNALAEELRRRGLRGAAMSVATPTVRGNATFTAISRRDSDPEEPLLRATFDGELTLPSVAEPEPPATGEASAVAVAAAATTGAAAAPSASTVPTGPANRGPPRASDAPPATTLADARRLARDRLTSVVLPAFFAGLPPGEAVAVKIPFRARSGDDEYMWVELRRVDGAELSGVLLNEPYDVAGLRKGDPIAFRVTDVFDYVWKKADGAREGNTTAAFLE